METRETINKIVNYCKDSKEVTVLGEVFIHSDGYHGATGSKFEIISKLETIKAQLNTIKNQL